MRTNGRTATIEPFKPRCPAPAAKRWTQLPSGVAVLVEADGSQVVLEEEINSREAARLLGVSLRWMQNLCDTGVLHEQLDWRKLPARGTNGGYRIKRAAVMRLRRES